MSSKTKLVRTVASARGMTLIEIMVVITILALMATAVAVNVMGSMAEARTKQAKSDIATLKQCLDLYKVDKGRYPSTEEGLQALVAAKKCEDKLKDPWSRDYIYLSPGTAHPDSFDIKSLGADGQSGGDGENADVTN
jgi:general secretion pathway protein G